VEDVSEGPPPSRHPHPVVLREPLEGAGLEDRAGLEEEEAGEVEVLMSEGRKLLLKDRRKLRPGDLDRSSFALDSDVLLVGLNSVDVGLEGGGYVVIPPAPLLRRQDLFQL